MKTSPGKITKLQTADLKHPFEEYRASLVAWGGGKESAPSVGDLDLMPGSGRSPGGGNGNALQYSCLVKPWTEQPGGLLSVGSQRLSLRVLGSQLPLTHSLTLRNTSFWQFHPMETENPAPASRMYTGSAHTQHEP